MTTPAEAELLDAQAAELPPPPIQIPAQDAPYGRRADGAPRGKPGPKPKGGPKASTSPGGPPAPPRRPGGPKPPTAPKPPGNKSKASTVDYRPGINGLLQIAAFPLAMAGQRNPSFALDAAAIGMHGPNIAEALNQIAQERPEVAAALEKILSVGPYGLLIGACLPLVAQVLTNHGKLPGEVAAKMGAVPAEDFRAMLTAGAPA